MAYGDEKVIADVREGERGQVLHKDAEGKERTYYPTGHIYFDLQDLQTLVVLTEAPDKRSEPVLVRRIRGTARLEDRSLSVIGDPKSATRTLSMTFEAGDWRPEDKSADEHESELVAALSTFLGGALLSFERSDLGIGNEDEWWSACYLPKPFIEQLEAAVIDGHLASLRVGLALRGLYSDEGDWAPASSQSNLFIRPNRENNDIGRPDLATGYVTSVVFATAKIDIRQPAEAEGDDLLDDPSEDPAERGASTDPVAAAIAGLAARIEATRGTIKWVGGLIVVALLFVAGR